MNQISIVAFRYNCIVVGLFIYREGCTYTPDFLNRLKEACPDARVTTEIGEGGKIIETNSYYITTFYLCV